MFTGIITHKGKILELKKTDKTLLKIAVDEDFTSELGIGDSISVDGACLTVLEFGKNSFQIQLMPETVNVTSFSAIKVGDEVNLEKSMRIEQRIDGHLVQGHIDGVGVVDDFIQEKDNWVLSIQVPPNLRKYIIYKGSVSVNGVSLTISKKTKYGLEVSLIEHTLKLTNLKDLKIDNLVNIEIDVITRYIESLIKSEDD
jgi:riboflavin synthase